MQCRVRAVGVWCLVLGADMYSVPSVYLSLSVSILHFAYNLLVVSLTADGIVFSTRT